MCGGRGTRLDATVEKPLYEVGGRPMVDRVIDALAPPTDTVYAVVSPHTPETAAHVDVPTIEAPGEGYVADLQFALDRVGKPVLTAAGDLPLLTAAVVQRVLDAYDGGSLTVCVPAARKRELGVSVDTTIDAQGRELAPTGVNIVGDGAENRLVFNDVRLASNVNRAGDAAVAEGYL